MKSLFDRGFRQGSLISCTTDNLPAKIREEIQSSRAIPKRRLKPVTEKHCLVLLSQDCDIANEHDPYIELLAITKVKPKEEFGPLKKNRNYRRLQLPIGTEYWLCDIDYISVIPKAILTDTEVRTEHNLEKPSKDILIDWRVGRYTRKPFPHGFNQAFLADYVKSPGNELGRLLLEHNRDIVDLFVYVSPMDVEHADEYRVSITALLSNECSPDNEASISHCLIRHCEVLHHGDNILHMLQVSEEPVLDASPPLDLTLRMSDFTFLDAYYMSRINLDFLCYDDPDDSE